MPSKKTNKYAITADMARQAVKRLSRIQRHPETVKKYPEMVIEDISEIHDILDIYFAERSRK